MKNTKLGSTGLEVSRLCLGCMSYGEPAAGAHSWTLDEETSRPFIKRALEAGINFLDTANVYSAGRSEEILGRAIRDFASRDEVVIATKVYSPMRQGPNGMGLSRKAIMSEIDASTAGRSSSVCRITATSSTARQLAKVAEQRGIPRAGGAGVVVRQEDRYRSHRGRHQRKPSRGCGRCRRRKADAGGDRGPRGAVHPGPGRRLPPGKARGLRPGVPAARGSHAVLALDTGRAIIINNLTLLGLLPVGAVASRPAGRRSRVTRRRTTRCVTR